MNRQGICARLSCLLCIVVMGAGFAVAAENTEININTHSIKESQYQNSVYSAIYGLEILTEKSRARMKAVQDYEEKQTEELMESLDLHSKQEILPINQQITDATSQLGLFTKKTEYRPKLEKEQGRTDLTMLISVVVTAILCILSFFAAKAWLSYKRRRELHVYHGNNGD